jgi:hypothetical protein
MALSNPDQFRIALPGVLNIFINVNKAKEGL